MFNLGACVSVLLGISIVLVNAVPAPVPTTPAQLVDRTIEDRASSCTFTAASAASASKKSCSTIVLSNIAVPSGVTLDMTGLNSGTHVSIHPLVSRVYQSDFICRSSSKVLQRSATRSGQAP